MPYPVDAHPIVGFTKEWTNLYIAVMHSGATLAPLMGKLIADEIVNRLRHIGCSETFLISQTRTDIGQGKH